MNLNELEKDLRDFRPANHDKINTELLWDRVSPHIPQSKRKHRYFSFFIMFLSVALIALITKSVLPKDREIQAKNQDVSEAYINKTSPNEDNAIINSDDDDIEITKYNKSEIINKSNPIQDKQLKRDKKSNSILKQAGNAKRHELEEVSADEFGVKQNKETTLKTTRTNAHALNNNYVQNESNINVVDRNSTPVYESGSAAKTLLDKETEESNNAYEYFENGIQQKEKGYLTKKSLPNKITDSKFITNKVVESRQLLSVFSLKKSLDLFEVQNSKPSFAPKRINPYVYRDHPKMSIEIGGSYLFPNRTLTLTNPEFSSELENRELAEEVLEGWYASVGFRYNVTPQLGISVGMQYGSINERSSKSLSYTETLFLEDTIIGNLIRVDGSVDPIYGDLEIDRTIMKNVSRINSYTFLQMPIELIYTQPISRLNLELGFGIIQNISFKQSGFWHPDDRSEYDLSIDERGYLKSKLGLGLTGRLGIGYDLTPGIGVYGHARFIKHLSGVTSANYGIDQSYSLMGAELGLRLHLFN